MRFLFIATLATVMMVSGSSAHAAFDQAQSISSAQEVLAADAVVDIDSSGLATAFWNGQTGDPVLETGIVTRTRSGDAGWQPPVVVSEGLEVGQFDAAVGEGGRAIVAWVSTGRSIYAAHRSSAGTWSDAELVKSATGAGIAPEVRVAIDDAGNAVVVWRFENGTAATQSAYARYRSSAGAWSGEDNLSGTSVPGGDGLDVIADSLGNFTAVWHRLGGDFRVATSIRAAGSASTWSAPVNPVTSESLATGPPVLAADANGNLLLAFVQQVDILLGGCAPCTVGQVWAVRKPAGSGWEAAHVASDEFETADVADRPQVAFDAAGNATIVWVEESGDDAIRTTTRDLGGGWSAPAPVHEANTEISDLSLAVDHVGAGMLLWRSVDAIDTYRIEMSARAPGGAWSAAELQAESIAPSTASSNPSVAMTGIGGAAAVWNAESISGTPPTETFARYSKPMTPSAGPPPPVTTPRIGRVTVSPKKVYRKARVRGSKKKRRTSANVQFSLSEPATVTIEFEYRYKGRVIGGKCVRQTRRNIRRRACERVSPWGKPITSQAGTGASSIAFSAKRLRNGNYYVIVRATAPSGATATPVRAKMTVG